jgi:predicted nucleotidyltransferase
MTYGIKEEYWNKLESVFRNHKNIEKVILYGSRAKEINSPYSDVDIILVGENIENREFCNILNEIDDLLLPFIFDISVNYTISNVNLIDSINKTGVIVYEDGSLCFNK